jgi:hypothetical protein
VPSALASKPLHSGHRSTVKHQQCVTGMLYSYVDMPAIGVLGTACCSRDEETQATGPDALYQSMLSTCESDATRSSCLKVISRYTLAHRSRKPYIARAIVCLPSLTTRPTVTAVHINSASSSSNGSSRSSAAAVQLACCRFFEQPYALRAISWWHRASAGAPPYVTATAAAWWPDASCAARPVGCWRR